ncbi:MAG: hypothetical protein Kow00122_04730 [Thermoleophilia bacterium]
MAAPARVWQHPRWSYDESASPAARRAAARMAARAYGTGAARAAAPREGIDPWVPPRIQAVPAPAPRLREVRRSRIRLLPVLVVLLVAGGALLGPTSLNLAAMRAEWRTAQLEQRKDDLLAQRAALQTRVSALSSTQRVEEAARRLGMVPAPVAGFLTLPGGRGDAVPPAWAAVDQNVDSGENRAAQGGGAAQGR